MRKGLVWWRGPRWEVREKNGRQGSGRASRWMGR